MPHAQQLGRYQLLDRIAFGGMAEIFRAKTFDGDGRVHMVAVKRVLNHLTNDEDFLRMLVDEARLTALIQHDNVAQVYEFAHTDGEYFIAMEYVDGKDVRVLLERHRVRKTPIAPEHVAWIVMEVAHALHAAHRQRDAGGRAMHIVHRDVSPSNVLLSYNGEVKLCDFGIAKATLTRVQTKTGVIKGKVKYMSPEQAMGRRLDHRSDLFSLGTVMYEMLTMEAPFQAATEVELIFAVRDAVKRPARELVPAIPEELNNILDRLMSRSRSQRFQSGEEVALALRVFLDRYRPGYRRSHFGRFMRQEFAADIEKELRLLEEYVIDSGDANKVGENLLADVLGPNAVYTQFTAAAQQPAETPIGTTGARPAEESTLAPHGELHALPTRILASTPSAPQPVGDLHAQETKILTMPHEGDPPSEAGETGEPGDTGESTIGGKLHELETKILAMPTQSLHELKTKILKRDQVLKPGAETDAHTMPAPPKVVVEPAEKKSDVDEDEETSVPLKDDDLEPA